MKGPKLVIEIANIPLSALFLLMFPRHKTDNFSSQFDFVLERQ
jgi:hypothetical protein